MACDDEHVYVTDQMRCRVVKCALTTGKLVLSYGRSGSGEGELDTPWALAIADTSADATPGSGGGGGGARRPCARTLFVSDQKNHRVVALDASDLTYRYSFGRWGFDGGDLIAPTDIAVHDRTLIVADGGNQRVCLFSTAGAYLRVLGPDGPGSLFAHKPHHVALTADAAFVIETPLEPKGEKEEKAKVPGRVHVLCPLSGAKLRPPLAPPFSSSIKGESSLTGVAVFRDALWVSSSFGMLLKLPRNPAAAAKPKSKGGEEAVAEIS